MTKKSEDFKFAEFAKLCQRTSNNSLQSDEINIMQRKL